MLQPFFRLTLRIAVILTVILGALQSSFAFASDLSVNATKCEMSVDPLGVDLDHPRLSWMPAGTDRGEVTTAYQVLVANSEQSLSGDKGDCWDSGKVAFTGPLSVEYAGAPLISGGQYFWKVRIWDKADHPSDWSKPSTWTMGLLKPDDWKAKWISSAADAATTKPSSGPLPIFRKSFAIEKPIRRAMIFICGLGQFELHLNGEKVGDNVMEPGWTDYHKTCLYVTYDVTAQMKQGENAIAAMLGNGIYNIPRHRGRYQKLLSAFGNPVLIAQLRIEHTDGSIETIATDRDWKSTAGPLTFADLYGGEDFDARKLQAGWDNTGFDDSAWAKSAEVSGPGGTLAGLSRSAPPIRIAQTFEAKSISQPQPGIFVFDFGQNAAFVPAITVSGSSGAAIKMVPGELLSRDGTVSQATSAGPTWFTYTLNGSGTESWSPRFTYYGSRYWQVSGAMPETEANASGLPVIHSISAHFITSTSEPAGEFSCSNELFNRTSTLIRWAMHNNMVSVLTDCPHRERLGWLEQTHLVGPSLMDNFNIHALFDKMCWDMTEAQTAEGLVPDIAPEFNKFGGGFRDSPEWGSACILIPWQVYQWYGDESVLRLHYDTMQRYVDYLGTKAKDHVLNYGLGDWYDLGPKRPGVAQLTPVSLTATAFYFRDIDILEKIARLLGKNDDADKDAALAAQVAKAFNDSQYDPKAHTYATGSQTSNALPLVFGLVPEQDRDAVLNNLVADIRNRNNGLTAGDIGYRYVLRALADAGRSDVIFDMNSRSDRPGYGYILAKGATSLTEGWAGTGSQDHFMLGHIMEWFYANLAGIQQVPDSVGFDKIIIRPTPVGDVTWVKASYECPHGKIVSNWKLADGKFTSDVTIPLDATATIYLPTKDSSTVTMDGAALKDAQGVTIAPGETGTAIQVNSGSYHFESSWK
jgi:hypothetical protein